MKKVIISVVVVLGLVLGIAGIWAYQQSNSFTNESAPTPPEIGDTARTPQQQPSQSTATDDSQPQRRMGTFQPRNNEQISGSASLTGDTIRLEDDFRTENGPDLFLYIGSADDRTVEIAKLKAANGAQNYKLPASINPDSVSHIWIYCRAFDLNFGVAELN